MDSRARRALRASVLRDRKTTRNIQSSNWPVAMPRVSRSWRSGEGSSRIQISESLGQITSDLNIDLNIQSTGEEVCRTPLSSTPRTLFSDITNQISRSSTPVVCHAMEPCTQTSCLTSVGVRENCESSNAIQQKAKRRRRGVVYPVRMTAFELERGGLGHQETPMITSTVLPNTNLQNDTNPRHQRTIYQKEDFGPPGCVCPNPKCQAVVWMLERSVRSQVTNTPKFSICCQNGKVEVPYENDPPHLMKHLLDYNGNRLSQHFRQNIREFNCRFSFTSTGGKIDTHINDGGGPYVFRMKGQNHHRIGSLVPPPGQRPRFAQLYIHDTENETINRLNSFGRGDYNHMDIQIIERVTDMLNANNQLVQEFRTARDFHRNLDALPVRIRLLSSRSSDGRRYNLPSASEVAAITVGLDEDEGSRTDIIIFNRDHGPQSIDVLHPKLMALHFPLLIPCGSDGFHNNILHGEIRETRVRKKLSMREFYAFQLQHRHAVYSVIQRGGRLFQQYVVYAYCCILEDRFTYLRTHQNIFRCELLYGLQDAVARGDNNSSLAGRPCILPSSFTGGPRYMAQAFQDAMAICRWLGHPDLFVTMTCNPKWNEILKFLELIPGQTPEDRPDIVARVFEMKLFSLLQDITRKGFFGRCNGVITSIEFQKRGLSHAHIALFLHPDDKLRDEGMIDKFISAELPDKNTDPVGFEAVSKHMMHGPCGVYNRQSPCMVNGKCSKHYPHKFQTETQVSEDGYPIYRRRESSQYVEKGGSKLDNTWVVPHNVDLVVKHDCHICIEKTNRDKCVKYLCKYMHKGSDRSTAVIEGQQNNASNSGEYRGTQVDEIKQYLDCRYISASEACWRIFGFYIHKHDPPVERLSFHLPNEQNVVFAVQTDLADIVTQQQDSVTKFLGWMECNKRDDFARTLTYVEFPSMYVWKSQDKVWCKRKKGRSVGRIRFVHPSAGEKYYLRLLLNVVRGPTCFEDIRTVNGNTHDTFREACLALGLLEGDGEWHEALREASHWAMPCSLRELFVTLLLFCQVSEPVRLWNNNRDILCDDVLFNQRRLRDIPDLTLNEDDITNYGLYEVEKIMNRLGHSLKEYEGMPFPDLTNVTLEDNSLIFEELNYNRDDLESEHSHMFAGLNECQLSVYERILNAIDCDTGGFFFVYGSGGTGKTYLWRTLLAHLRSKGLIALAVASSGIAALLLPGGKTAHSRLKIPIELDKDSLLNVKPRSHIGDLICKSSLIIWDEAPMAHRHAFEALDRSLRDLMRTVDESAKWRVFGGKTVVLGGDFRQILPVVPYGKRADVVAATVCSSHLWSSCEVHVLTQNMRLSESDNVDVASFRDWLLKLGEGKLPLQRVSDDEEDACWLKIPERFLIPVNGDALKCIIESTYPDLYNRLSDLQFLKERAILSPRNETVDTVNSHIIDNMDGDSTTYLSADRVSRISENVDSQVELYPTEYLNTLSFSGIPNHVLTLKVGVPIILMRNLNTSNGLCNGTRLIVTKLASRVIEAEILTGACIGRRCLIPRVELIPSESKLPFQLARRQFPIKPCFAMTINKSQGQTFDRIGLYLPEPVFTHGQLYVAASRVTNPNGFNVLLNDTDPSKKGMTKNIVYTEVFDKLYSW